PASTAPGGVHAGKLARTLPHWSQKEVAVATTTMNNVRTISFVNIALGVWLFISAFIWPHTSAQFNNAWIVGALSAIVGALALRYPDARWANTALGAWLFLSVWFLPTMYSGTLWNHLIVGAAMFIVSLIPGRVG